MTGEASASVTASADSWERRLLLLPFSSLLVTTLPSGVATISTADKTITAHRPPSSAVLPLAASRTARYATDSTAPIQAPRCSEYSSGPTATTTVVAAIRRWRRVPVQAHATRNGSRMVRQSPQRLV